MVPSTKYGAKSQPVFRNIFVEDPPQVLFSLKIDPSVSCPKDFCSATFLRQSSSLSLKIENLYSPESIVKNSIGFEILPAGYIANPTDSASQFPTDYTLKGLMHIDLANVWIKARDGVVQAIANWPDAELFGNLSIHGDVDMNYSLGPAPPFDGLLWR
jgi:hypothetical protein